MPAVSICIPTYKQIECLNKCLDSVLVQDFKDFELIISDDTPDDSVQRFIEKKLQGLQYSYFHHSPSLGSPANWNFAIGSATGDFIKIMHHDDFFSSPKSLSLMVERIQAEESDFLYTSAHVIYKRGNTQRIQATSQKQLRILQKDPSLLFFKNVIMGPSATLYRNVEAKFDESLIWLVDIDFYIRKMREGKFSYINEPLISLVHNVEGQISDQVLFNKQIQIREHVLVFNKLYTHIKNIKPYQQFFDYLFADFNVHSFEELIDIAPMAQDNSDFFLGVVKDLNRHRRLKSFIRRCYGSRYNNYIFKLEQFHP